MAAPTAVFPYSFSVSRATHSQSPQVSYSHFQSKRRAAQLQAFAWAVPAWSAFPGPTNTSPVQEGGSCR